jgi:hypothetical protein
MKLSEMNKGNIGGEDFGDIMEGVNHLIEQGLANSSNLSLLEEATETTWLQGDHGYKSV